MLSYPDRDMVADLVWLKTGKSPVSVRFQALLVIATFEDGQLSVHRIEDLRGLVD